MITAPILTSGEVRFVQRVRGPDLLEIPDESDPTRVETTLFMELRRASHRIGDGANQQGIELMKSKSDRGCVSRSSHKRSIRPDRGGVSQQRRFACTAWEAF